jgi:hypothetical protein
MWSGAAVVDRHGDAVMINWLAHRCFRWMQGEARTSTPDARSEGGRSAGPVRSEPSGDDVTEIHEKREGLPFPVAGHL